MNAAEKKKSIKRKKARSSNVIQKLQWPSYFLQLSIFPFFSCQSMTSDSGAFNRMNTRIYQFDCFLLISSSFLFSLLQFMTLVGLERSNCSFEHKNDIATTIFTFVLSVYNSKFQIPRFYSSNHILTSSNEMCNGIITKSIRSCIYIHRFFFWFL